MKASELRIGNYVRFGGKEFVFGRIAGVYDRVYIEFDGCEALNEGNHIRSLESDFDEYLTPIPLTEEWLVKFGFEKIQRISYVNGFEFVLKPDDDLEFNGIGHHGWLKGDRSLVVNTLCRGNYVCNSVQYVHQLQNLYFALTGEELTIK